MNEIPVPLRQYTYESSTERKRWLTPYVHFYNDHVRPGTWVTNQTGHIGYTLCLFSGLGTTDLSHADRVNSRSDNT